MRLQKAECARKTTGDVAITSGESARSEVDKRPRRPANCRSFTIGDPPVVELGAGRVLAHLAGPATLFQCDDHNSI
jgi:hypothetical protein